PETVDADRAEDGREEAHSPDAQEENPLLVRISGRVEESHEARKEGDRPDRSEDVLEQFRGANDFASRRVDDSDFERVEQPGAGDERGDQAGEDQQQRERDQAEPEIPDVPGTEEVQDFRHHEQVDREWADRKDDRIAEANRSRPRHADVEASLAGDRPVCAVRRTRKSPDERRKQPEDDGDDSHGDKVNRQIPRGDSSAEDREQRQKEEDRYREDGREAREVSPRRGSDHAAADSASHIPLSAESDLWSPPTWPSLYRYRSFASSSCRAPGQVGLNRPRERVSHPSIALDVGMQPVGRTAKPVRGARRGSGGMRVGERNVEHLRE